MLIDLILAAVAALAQGEPAPQQEKKAEARDFSEREYKLEAKVLELGVKHFKAPKDKDIYSELALAEYELASLRWTSAEEQRTRDKGQHSQELQDKYAAARSVAELALKMTVDSATASTPEIEERIGKCYLIIGAASLHEGNADKGLAALRNGFSWADQQAKDIIARTMFRQYLKSGLEGVVKEFERPSLRDALLDQTDQYLSALSAEGRKAHFEWHGGEQVTNGLNLFAALATHQYMKQLKKPEQERDTGKMINYFFTHYSLAFSAIEGDDKSPVLNKMPLAYQKFQKAFPGLKPLQEEYREWGEHQKKSGILVPGIDGLRKALEKKSNE